MKKLITLISIISCCNCYCQTIPFRFKNENIEKSRNLLPVDFDSNQLLNQYSDSIGIFKARAEAAKSKNYYHKFEKALLDIHKEREEKITNLFIIKNEKLLNDLNNATSLSDIEKLRNEIEDAEKEKRKAYKDNNIFLRYAQEMNYKALNFNNFQLFPVRNAVGAQMYYDNYLTDKKSKFLKNTLVSLSSEGSKASIFNELYADYFGPLRVGVGVLLSNTNNDPTDSDSISSQKDAVQRLLGGGGNTTFSLSYPLLGYTDSQNAFSFKLITAPKFAVDIPKIGTSSDKSSTNLDLGFEGSIYYSGLLDILTIYSNFRIGYVTGNKYFYENLIKTDSKSFFFNQASIGIAINSTFRIGYNYFWGNQFVKDNFPATFSLTIVPN
ncbi:hypothetical protein OF897_12165 [Chryseobacterium formosus]|uniref:Uncharacterized protein n=1 Tax=Chryseobacterium formosus TaxID=1537363 RepID=A0ABT3XT69_9FLAO|nr:hypothetical protein [Chryseobacterium formosus]MCX8524668.1 hypothetical protein [Chryseobacterium formosus]